MSYLEEMRRNILEMSIEPAPAPWKEVATVAIGGLLMIGLSPSAGTEHILVISHNGRGLLNARTGELVARDRTPR